MKKITLLMAIVSISACTTTGGRNFDTADVTKIREGTTTTAEVERLLGVPLNKEVWVDGTEQWNYSWNVTKTSPTLVSLVGGASFTRAERDAKAVNVKFKRGVVTECVYSTFSNENAPGQTVQSAIEQQGETRSMRCQDAR
jgi:outer membrane protein assembly factor BamE (lipoprotein component of BamABCDE complex)